MMLQAQFQRGSGVQKPDCKSSGIRGGACHTCRKQGQLNGDGDDEEE